MPETPALQAAFARRMTEWIPEPRCQPIKRQSFPRANRRATPQPRSCPRAIPVPRKSMGQTGHMHPQMQCVRSPPRLWNQGSPLPRSRSAKNQRSAERMADLPARKFRPPSISLKESREEVDSASGPLRGPSYCQLDGKSVRPHPDPIRHGRYDNW